ncbi:hypothetical protein [Rhodococcus sp. BE178]|uniref:hypothetical protein n=1 Tax=Rhodococcus sp. BE178 TaxID=2817737 RepID=UPI003D1F9234
MIADNCDAITDTGRESRLLGIAGPDDWYPDIASRVIGDEIMTDTAERSRAKTSSAELQLSFRDGVTSADRQIAEQSVAAMVERSAGAVAQRRSTEAEIVEATRSISGSIAKPIGEDLHADDAIAGLRTKQIVQPDVIDAMGHGVPVAAGMPYSPEDLGTVRAGSVGFVPPYDFQWAWHDSAGHPPKSILQNRSSGTLGLDARSGALPGGASGFVNAHAGFGVFLRSDTTGQRFPHAVLNPGRFTFQLRAVGVGANATSEGGFELTVFEDGKFLTGASRKLWRSRVGSSLFNPDESSSGGQENHPITGPELEFTLRRDHGYTFNAGIWVFSDRSTGVGAGAVQSLLQGILTRMWVFG